MLDGGEINVMSRSGRGFVGDHVVAIVIIVSSTVLLMTGSNGVIKGILGAVTLYYFGEGANALRLRFARSDSRGPVDGKRPRR